MIEAAGLCKEYGPEAGSVLDHLTFSLATGETMSIIGPSGCGKTTLLYLLSGLSSPSSGTLRISSNPESFRSDARTAFILQDFGLFPWKTVRENIELPLKLQKNPAKERRVAVHSLLNELGLSSHEGLYPVQLSGGQKQRVAIGRALATNPDLLLMDEPFSALDALTREHLQNTMLDMWRRRGITYIIVTHSVEEAVFLGGKIMILSDRPARIRDIIPNPVFGRAGCRTEEAFFEMVKRLRVALSMPDKQPDAE